MNKKDLKRLKLDPSFIISPERFITMFGVECDNIRKLNIHDLHYILGKSLNHVGINKISLDKIYTGEIILIGTPNHFKAYYRPIVYKIKVNNKIEEEISVENKSINNTKLSDLCDLCMAATNIEDLDEYLGEIYNRVNFDFEDELESNRTKIYTYPIRSRRY